MYYDQRKDIVCIEPDDQCDTCEHFARGVACPLLHALGAGVAYLADDCVVTNCDWYKEFKRTLRIVKDE